MSETANHKKLEHLDSHGFKKKIVAAPAVNQRFELIDGKQVNTSTEKHPGWMELIFDLAIVIVSQKIVHEFSVDIDRDDRTAPLLFALKFFAIYHVWYGVDSYANRFGQLESIMDSLFIFVEFVIIACISVSIEVYAGSEIETQRRTALSEICIGLSFAHFALFAIYCRVYFLVQEAKTFSLYCIIMEFISCAWWLIIGLIPIPRWVLFILWAIIVVFELCREILSVPFNQNFPFEYFGLGKYVYVPLNVGLSAERTGLLVVVAVGEIIAVVTGTNVTQQTYGAAILAVTQGFAIKFAYFDVFDCLAEQTEPTHAMRESRYRGMAHIRTQEVLVGAILVSSMYHFQSSGQEEGHRRALGMHPAADDHPVDDHAVDDHATDDGYHETGAYEDTHHKIIYRQLVYAFSLSLVLICCFLTSILHKRNDVRAAAEKVSLSVRGVAVLLFCLLLLLLGGFIEFDNHKKYQGIALAIMAGCMFFEFSCRWFLLDFPDITEHGDDENEASGQAGIELSANAGGGGDAASVASSNGRKKAALQRGLYRMNTSAFLSMRVHERCNFPTECVEGEGDTLPEGVCQQHEGPANSPTEEVVDASSSL